MRVQEPEAKPSLILYERRNSVSFLTLNRPEKRNALSREMIDALSSRLEELQSDQELRALVLTGAGDQAFCAGTDISELAKQDSAAGAEISASGQIVCDQFEAFPVPVIAAVNGIAAGGGFELALACHFRIASPSATFSLPETKLGLIPGYGGTQRLAREVGQGRALEIMLTGRSVSAEEAFELGLVNRLVNAGDVLAEATSFAAEISRLSPLSIRACLKAVTRGLSLPLEEGLALETEIFSSLFATEDVREGTSAFLEKREPIFKGK